MKKNMGRVARERGGNSLTKESFNQKSGYEILDILVNNINRLKNIKFFTSREHGWGFKI